MLAPVQFCRRLQNLFIGQVKPSHIVEISLRESTAQGLRQIFRKACEKMISVDRAGFALLLLLHDPLADPPIGLNYSVANAIVQFCNVLEQLAIGIFLKIFVHGITHKGELMPGERCFHEPRVICYSLFGRFAVRGPVFFSSLL